MLLTKPRIQPCTLSWVTLPLSVISAPLYYFSIQHLQAISPPYLSPSPHSAHKPLQASPNPAQMSSQGSLLCTNVTDVRPKKYPVLGRETKREERKKTLLKALQVMPLTALYKCQRWNGEETKCALWTKRDVFPIPCLLEPFYHSHIGLFTMQ